MIDKLKHTLKHTFVYSLGNLATKLIGLILLPLYTTHLTTEHYGILSILEISGQLLTIIFSANLSSTMMRWWVDAKTSEKRKSIVFTAFVMLFISLLGMNIVFQPLAGKFAIWFFDDDLYTVYFTILFFSSSFDIISKYMLDMLRLLEKSVLYITVTTIKLVLVLGLNIYFVVSLEMGVKGIILAQLIGFVFITIILLPIFVKHINLKFDKVITKEMLKYSAPLVFTTLSGMIFSIGDRYVLKFISGDSAVGIYTLSYKIAGMMKFVVLMGFTSGFTPIAFKMYNSPNADRFFSKIMTYLTMVLTYGGLGLALFSPEFVKLFSPQNKDYWEAAQYVGLIGIVVVLAGMRYMFSLSFNISKKTIYVPFIVTIFAGLNILLDFLTIPQLGINGAIISSIISSIFINFAYYYYGSKFYKIRYKTKRDILVLLIGIALYSITYFTKNLEYHQILAIKISISLIFPLIIYFGGFLEPIEKQRIHEYLYKIFHKSK
jgi:O-antigen/teichoic acid export membrane protein